MPGLPTIGAHAALTGVDIFDGNVKRVISSLMQMLSATERMATGSSAGYNSQAAAATKSAALVQKAHDAQTRATQANATAQAAAVKASVDRQIADQARLAASFAQMQSLQAARGVGSAAARGPLEAGIAKSALADQNIITTMAVGQAAQYDRVAKASERAAASAAASASKQEAAAVKASAAVTAFGNTTTAQSAKVSAGFGVMSTAATVMAMAVAAAMLIGIGALVGFVGAGIKSAAAYDQTMQQIAAVTEASTGQMEALDSAVRELAISSNKSLAEMAKGAQALVETGNNIEDVAEVELRVARNLSILSRGELDAAQAGEQLDNVMDGFNLTAQQSVSAGDAVAAVALRTRETFKQLMSMVGQAGPVMSSFGYAVEDVIAVFGALTEQGLDAETTAMGLRTSWARMTAETDASSKVMNKYGISLYDASGAARSMRDVIINFSESFSDQAIAIKGVTTEERNRDMQTLFGVRGQRTSIALANMGVEAFDRMTEAEKRLKAEDLVNTMLNPLSVQLERFGNNVNVAATTIGGSFLPIFGPMISGSLRWIEALNRNKTALELLGNTVSVLASGQGFAALYTQITDTFGGETGSKIIEFVNLLRNVGDAIGRNIGPAIDNLRTQLSNMFSGITTDDFANAMGEIEKSVNIITGIVGVIINVIAGLIEWFNKLPDAGKVAMVALAGGVVAASNPIIGAVIAIGAAFLLLPTVFNFVLDAIQGFVNGMFTISADIAKSLAFIGDLWDRFWTWVAQVVATISEWVANTLNAWGAVLSMIFASVGTAMYSVWGTAWDNLVKILANAIGLIGKGVSSIGTALGKSFSAWGPPLGRIWHSIWQGLVDVAASGIRALGGLLDKMLDALAATPIGQMIGPMRIALDYLKGAGVDSFNALGEAIADTQANFNALVGDVRAGVNTITSPFAGIDFSAGIPTHAPWGGGTAPPLPTRTAPPPAESEPGALPEKPDTGGGGKSDAEKAAEKAAEALKRLNELNEDTLRDLANLTDDTLEKIAAAWQKHNEDWITATQEAQNKITEIYAKRDKDIAEANAEFLQKRDRAALRQALQDENNDADLARSRRYEDEDRANQRALDQTRRARQEQRELKEQAFQYEIEDADRAAKQMLERQEAAIRKSYQAASDGMRRQQELQSRSLSDMFEAANQQRQQQYAVEDAAREQQRQQQRAAAQYARDLAGATTAEDRARLQQQYAQQQAEAQMSAAEAAQDRAIAAARQQQENASKKAQQAAEDQLKLQQDAAQKALQASQEAEDLNRRQAQENADVARQRANAKKVADYRKQLDDTERKLQQQEDDQAVKDKRARDDEERGIKKAEDQKLKDLEDGWELADHNEKIKNIGIVAQAEVDKTNETYAERLRTIDATLASELQKVEAGYEDQKRTIIQKWQDAWDELIATSPAIEGALNGLFAEFMANITATDNLIRGMINDLLTAAGIELPSAGSGEGPTGEYYTGQETAFNTTPASPYTTGQALQFGVTPPVAISPVTPHYPVTAASLGTQPQTPAENAALQAQQAQATPATQSPPAKGGEKKTAEELLAEILGMVTAIKQDTTLSSKAAVDLQGIVPKIQTTLSSTIVNKLTEVTNASNAINASIAAQTALVVGGLQSIAAIENAYLSDISFRTYQNLLTNYDVLVASTSTSKTSAVSAFYLSKILDALAGERWRNLEQMITAALNLAQSLESAAKALSIFISTSQWPKMATGGIVPGAYGQPQAIIAHGGEAVLPTDSAYLRDYLPVAKELASMIARTSAISTGPIPAQTTNVTYQVDANYSQYQSPASIALDLQAMTVMARR